MAEREQETLLQQTTEAVTRMQDFDAGSLARETELGQQLSFADAVPHAERLISLFKQIQMSALEDYPDQQLNEVKSQADNAMGFFKEVQDFKATQDNAATQRDHLTNLLRDQYDGFFSALQPHIAYCAIRTTDFEKLEKVGRSAIQTIQDETTVLRNEMNEKMKEANGIIENMREAAGEVGVSQQSMHFSKAVKEHHREADAWHKRLVYTSIGLGVYAFATLFFAGIPGLTSVGVELAASKVLIFAVISSYLVICIRNYLSHQHNAVVNKHRQNALATYKAIVDAAEDTPNREIILVQAAACIFGPQSTGYVKETNSSGAGVQQAVEFLTQPLKGGDR